MSDVEIAEATGPPEASARDLAGKYLTFVLSDEVYGLEILKVQEIIGIMKVTVVPRTPEFVRGVINLRGKVIPVIDLRLKFGMESVENTERTCVVVVQVAGDAGTVIMGVIVDEVSDVVDVHAKDIESAPKFGTSVNTDFILGMGKLGDRVVMLLDIDRVLSGDEITSINASAIES